MATPIVALSHGTIADLPYRLPGIVATLLEDCHKWRRRGYAAFGVSARFAWRESSDAFICEMEASSNPNMGAAVQLKVRILTETSQRNLLEAVAFAQSLMALGELRGQRGLHNAEDGWTTLLLPL